MTAFIVAVGWILLAIVFMPRYDKPRDGGDGS